MKMQNTAYKKSNFGGAFFFLPKEKREALGIIYAFCRYADDIADEGWPDAKERMAALRAELKNPQTQLGQDLAQVIKKYNIPAQYFTDLLDGMERDLNAPVRFETFGDLKWYMYRAAAVAGLMCIEVFGYKNPQVKDYAINLGYAVQLTNIVRDLKEDAKINRVYLPKADIESFGLTEADILNPRASVQLKALLIFELEKARDYYAAAAKLLPKEDFKTLLPARAMGNIYFAILKKLQKTPCRFEGKKIKLNKAEKLRVLYKTWREKK